MPLRAKCGHKDISAFDYDQKSWDILKSSYKNMGLLMPCCNVKAIPKTSKLGNFYFSHSKKDDCRSAAESQEHLYIKSMVAKTAKQAGWEVKTEWQDTTPSGEQWIADVFCKKGNARVVIEIQLSRQTLTETLSRQKKYKKSGVRCAWIASTVVFDKHYIKPNKETPFFFISKPVVGEEPTVERFNIPITNFVNHLLSGNIKWADEPWVYDIHYINDECWKCKKQNKQVLGYGIDVYGDQAKTVPNASTVLAEISCIADNEALRSLGLNYIGEFSNLKGNAPNFPFCNVCLHCGAPQSNYHLMENLIKNSEVKSIEYRSNGRFSGKWVLNEKL